MKLPRSVKNVILATWSLAGGAEAARLSRRNDLPEDYQRIYFWHIRKTAGTSLNRAFIAMGGEDTLETHRRMLHSLNKRVISGGKVFVGHNRYLIQQGRYFYAFSHHPWHEITLPSRTYMITCLRDPVKRVLSHYRMLVGMHRAQANTNSTRKEGHWATGSLSDFVLRTPREHLLRQLYMFSREYNIDEAVQRLSTCNFILHTEHFTEGIKRLSTDLKVPLESRRERTSPTNIEINESEIESLREVMEPEYEMLTRVHVLPNRTTDQVTALLDDTAGA